MTDLEQEIAFIRSMGRGKSKKSPQASYHRNQIPITAQMLNNPESFPVAIDHPEPNSSTIEQVGQAYKEHIRNPIQTRQGPLYPHKILFGVAALAGTIEGILDYCIRETPNADKAINSGMAISVVALGAGFLICNIYNRIQDRKSKKIQN